ncbi:MAG: ABC transporter permease [Anaerolineae bacterium]|nr:ABC transporter permease [Anaerolineae bacterium]
MNVPRRASDVITIAGAVVLALGLTTLMLAAVEAPPGDVFGNLLSGAFGTLVGEDGAISLLNPRTADTITFWVPLFLCSIGLLFTFTGGLWNIGVEGQMTMGAVAASFIALQVATIALPSDYVLVVPAEMERPVNQIDDLRRRPVGVMHPESLDGLILPQIQMLSFGGETDTAAAWLGSDDEENRVDALVATPGEAEQVIAAGAAAGRALVVSDVALQGHLPGWLLLALALAASMAGGALWALVCGVLKTRGSVHEIFGGVALNNLASIFAIYLISGPWQPPEGGSAQSTPLFPGYVLLPNLEAVSLDPLTLALALAAFVLAYLALRGTFWGLQLRAMGKNPRSAFLLGVPTEKRALGAFALCGALAGLAGSTRVLGVYDSLRPNIAGGIGFLALLVVLLARTRAVWVPFISFFFAAILSGSTRLKILMQLDASLAGVLQGFLVLAVIIALGVRGRLAGRRAAPVPGDEAPGARTDNG